jgi:hypothetical protein
VASKRRLAFSKQDEEDLAELERLLEMGEKAYSGGFEDGQRKMIVEKTRLWRETWVLPRIRRLLDRARGEK